MRQILPCLLLLFMFPGQSPADDSQQREFSSCISDWQLQAKDLGLQQSTIEDVIHGLVKGLVNIQD